MLCLHTCKYCGDFYPHFCSYFLCVTLPVRHRFPSRYPWKGEMPELMPESLSWFFGKTRFPACAMCSTCPAQVGDHLGALIQQGWLLLSGLLLPSFTVAGVPASSFLCLLLEGNSQVCAFRQICAETNHLCSGVSLTSEHPWVSRALINGATFLVSANPLAGLRSLWSLEPLKSTASKGNLQMQQVLGSTLRSEIWRKLLGCPLRTVRCGVQAGAVTTKELWQPGVISLL